MSDERESKFLWLDGELLPWSEANVHVTTIGVASSTAIFEGIRGYCFSVSKSICGDLPNR
jgi:branched-chain amino acid aminotransferase